MLPKAFNLAKNSSIRDIAARAGVSVASVSNVLNGKLEKVSAETARRIRELVKEFDYQPNMAARSLSMGKSQLVGLVLPLTVAEEQLIGLIGENPFYGEFFDGVESVLRVEGYDVILAGFRPEQNFSDWVRRRGLDGVILVGSYSHPMLDKLQSEGVAVILTDTEPELQHAFPNVGVDDAQGAYLATRHLVELGHRAIALAGGDTANSYVNACRENGYLKALAEAGLKADPALRYVNNVSLGGGMRIAQEILASPKRPDAVFCTADTLALGMMSVFQSGGLRVPEDCSVIGFDDLAIFRQLPPGLTTIRQDVVGKGAAAARLLLRQLSGENLGEMRLELPVSLVVRGSTGPR
jgi:LacI family transcriptional regulator